MVGGRGRASNFAHPDTRLPSKAAVPETLPARTECRNLANLANWVILLRPEGRRGMPTRNINLTDEQDAFVERMVKAGRYQNASEAMRDAVRGLQQRWKEDELKLKALRKLVREGASTLERGESDEVDDADLDAYLDRLGARASR